MFTAVILSSEYNNFKASFTTKSTVAFHKHYGISYSDSNEFPFLPLHHLFFQCIFFFILFTIIKS